MTSQIDPDDGDENRLSLKGSDYLDISDWMGHFTYNEVHSFTIGFAPALVAMVTGVAVWWQVVLVGFLVAIGVWKVENRVLNTYLVKDPHYFAGGVATAVLVGAFIRLAFALVGIVP